ncbi:RHS repeat-associated core domain-containing protein [Microbacterium tumbae]
MDKPVAVSVGLTVVGARTYDPVLGKFLSVDPVIDTGLPQQNTGYAYSGNNPVTYSDPTGLKFAIAAPDASGGGKVGGDYKVPWGPGKPYIYQPGKPKVQFTEAQLENLGDALQYSSCAKYPTIGVPCGPDYAEVNNELNAAVFEATKVVVILAVLRGSPTASRVAIRSGTGVASQLERTGTALTKSDVFHRSVTWGTDNPLAQQFSITGNDGAVRDLYQLKGELNGKSGIFEWIIDRSGPSAVVTHQRFIPGGSVTGVPNQVVP